MAFRRIYADQAMQLAMRVRLSKLNADTRKWMRLSGLKLKKTPGSASYPIVVINPRGKIRP